MPSAKISVGNVQANSSKGLAISGSAFYAPENPFFKKRWVTSFRH